jgi:hypothetical protein
MSYFPVSVVSRGAGALSDYSQRVPDREVRSSNGRPLLVVVGFFFLIMIIIMTDPRHQELSFPIAMRYE